MVDWPDPSDLFNLLVDMFNWFYEQQWHYLQCSSSSQYTPENSMKQLLIGPRCIRLQITSVLLQNMERSGWYYNIISFGHVNHIHSHLILPVSLSMVYSLHKRLHIVYSVFNTLVVLTETNVFFFLSSSQHHTNKELNMLSNSWKCAY